eukprot:gene24189-29370_t
MTGQDPLLGSKSVYDPEKVDGLPSDLSKIITGPMHNLAVTENGRLWGWGRNSEGQIRGMVREDWEEPGITTRGNFQAPIEISGPWVDLGRRVVEAAASGVVSYAIDCKGDLWSWGYSKRGQLGLGVGITQATQPQLVPALSGLNVVSISAGWGHTLCRTESGLVYAWGYSTKGRLGFEMPGSAPPTEERLCASRASDAADAVSRADVFINEALEEEEAQLAAAIVWDPTCIQSLANVKVAHVACGMDHSLVVSEDGSLFAFGEDRDGQLGPQLHRNASNRDWAMRTLFLEEPVLTATAGMSHTVVVTKEHKIYTLGSNFGGSDEEPSPVEVDMLQGENILQ